MPHLAARGTDWSEDELIIAVYLYRFGWEDLGVTYNDIATLMHRKPSTITYRFANFLSYDGVQTGLQNGGKFAKEVYSACKTLPREQLRQRAIHALLSLSRLGITAPEGQQD